MTPAESPRSASSTAAAPHLVETRQQTVHSRTPLSSFITSLVFCIVLFVLCLHCYRYPEYNIDMLNYMTNMAALEKFSAAEIHAQVYRELDDRVPPETRLHLLGLDAQGSPQQINSLQDRAHNPAHLVEFLPCFSTRALYVEFLHVLRKFNVGMLKAIVLATVIPYYLLGLLIFGWSSLYIKPLWAMVLTLLAVVSPAVLNLGRVAEPDCLSVLWLCLALFFLFERVHLCLGFAFLLGSIFIRTDNVLLALIVIGYFVVRTKQLEIWKAFVLAALSVAAVFFLNHFAGDYGWRLLYYRGFIAPPLAPGEFVAHFSLLDYQHALRKGFSDAINSNLIPYALLGGIGYLAYENRPLRLIYLLTMIFSLVHFLIFPLMLDRYFGLYYVVMSLSAIQAISRSQFFDQTRVIAS